MHEGSHRVDVEDGREWPSEAVSFRNRLACLTPAKSLIRRPIYALPERRGCIDLGTAWLGNERHAGEDSRDVAGNASVGAAWNAAGRVAIVAHTGTWPCPRSERWLSRSGQDRGFR